ncbi:MAG: hypothetical protein R3D00_27045 [Bacteroidia bacterium]
MKKTIHRYLIVESLAKLGETLRKNGVPAGVVAKAVHENPWFTPGYIQQAVSALGVWMEENTLKAFVDSYPERKTKPRNVALIAAGNIPLVGWHDVMAVILSGHIAHIRCSHKDQVLMHWLVEAWVQQLPALADRIFWDVSIAKPDFLIGTGSNNTARYLEAKFSDVPRIIRKNRYSLAVLRPNMAEDELDGLMEDIFLYNGLGCRNVNNLLVMPGTDWERIWRKIDQYPSEYLNPLYLERVLHEKAKMVVWGEPLMDCDKLLILPAVSPGRSEMGVIRKISVEGEAALVEMIAENKHELQCIVGIDTPFGATQYPSLSDFADDINTMDALLQI